MVTVERFKKELIQGFVEFWEQAHPREQSGEHADNILALLSMPYYNQDLHLIARENESIVASAFILTVEYPYLVIKTIPGYAWTADMLFSAIIELAKARGMKHIYIATEKSDRELQAFVTARKFRFEKKELRLNTKLNSAQHMPVHTHVAEPSDFEEIIEVLEEAFHGEHVDVRRYIELHGEQLTNGEFIVIVYREDQVIAGAIVLQINPNDERKAYIPLVGVRGKFRHCGIGRALVESAKAWAYAHGVNEISLAVNSENACAVELYLKSGFEIYDEVYLYSYMVE
jgi:ribosomal protein S18 acetylase RimI-like enzyme